VDIEFGEPLCTYWGEPVVEISVLKTQRPDIQKEKRPLARARVGGLAVATGPSQSMRKASSRKEAGQLA
jgi:hypothetical protein